MKKKFVWEKWRDPLLSNLKNNEWPGFDLDADGDTIPSHSVEKQPVMHTPMGMLSVLDNTFATSQFDFWLMHTNFNIKAGMIAIIDQVLGVETVEVYTKHRARIGFPRSGLFVPREVMHNIECSLIEAGYQEQNQILVGLEVDTANNAIETRSMLASKYENWAMWVIPNGNLEVIGTDTIDSQYTQMLLLLKSAVQTVGGRLLTSEGD